MIIVSLPDPDDIELPRAQAGGSPQRLLLTMLGDYWYGQRIALSSAALIALMEEFGSTTLSTRAALTRLTRRQLLAAQRDGRRASYALTVRAAAMLDDSREHLLAFGETEAPWAGTWTIAAFSVPECQRDLRHTLRTRLDWLGFAPLYDGVWVCPHERMTEVAKVFTELKIYMASVFRAEAGADAPIAGNPIRAWNLDAVSDQYVRLLNEYGPVRERLRAGQIGTAEALLVRTALIDAWRSLPSLDPDLPTTLLPPDWPRARARQLFIELYNELAPLAGQRVAQIVSRLDAAWAAEVQPHTT